MKTIGSHPGAILFRLGIMVILILILILYFLSYVEDIERDLERASILQTKRIIDSSLAVVFSTYAVSNRLDDLNDLNGGNPFQFLAEFKILPPAYIGEIDNDLNPEIATGWYYLNHRRMIAYKSIYVDSDSYFKVVLKYSDLNESGAFESRVDRFKSLLLVEVDLF